MQRGGEAAQREAREPDVGPKIRMVRAFTRQTSLSPVCVSRTDVYPKQTIIEGLKQSITSQSDMAADGEAIDATSVQNAVQKSSRPIELAISLSQSPGTST